MKRIIFLLLMIVSYSLLFAQNDIRAKRVTADSLMKAYKGLVAYRLGITSTAPSAKLHILTNGVNKANQTDSNGILLQNTTAAVTTTDSLVSPPIVFYTSGRKTSGGAGAQPVKFKMDAYGVLGNPTAGGIFRIASVSRNNGAYKDLLTIRQDGFIGQNLNINGIFYGSSTAIGSVAIGSSQPLQHETTSASENVGIGSGALNLNTDGGWNIAIGGSSLSSNLIGNFNIGIGSGSLSTNTSDLNIGIGYHTLQLNTTGQANTAIGVNSLTNSTTAQKNTSIGAGSLENTTTGGFNSAVGEDAFLHNTTGINNTGMGWLTYGLNATGSNNTVLGFNALVQVANGSNNVGIGSSVNSSKDTVDNVIAIGYNAAVSGSNQIVIGNSSHTQATFYGLTNNNIAALTVALYDTTTNRLYHTPSSQLRGTATNDNAATGNIGEYVSHTTAVANKIVLTTGTVANVDSITLTAGDWDVTGQVDFNQNVATNIIWMQYGSSATSATLGSQDSYSTFGTGNTFNSSIDILQPIPTVRYSLSGTTKIYLVAKGSFSVLDQNAYGTIRARRIR